MVLAGNESAAQAQRSAAEALTSSQATHSSAESQVNNSSVRTGKRANAEDGGGAPAQLAAPSPYMLPIELLTEIFSNLFTTDVLAATLVCRSWHAATKSPRVWRNFDFKPTIQPPRYFDLDSFYDYVDMLIRKSNEQIEGINFTHLSEEEVYMMGQRTLWAPVDTMRRIIWLPETKPPESSVLHLLDVTRYLRHLEMLDFRIRSSNPTSFDEFVSEPLEGDLLEPHYPAPISGLRNLHTAPVALPSQSKLRLKLIIGSDFADQVLERLSKQEGELFWKGLQEVKIEVTQASLGSLVGLIAARQAGARCASKDQYLDILASAQSRSELWLEILPQREILYSLTTFASSMVAGSTHLPLCPEVVWKILAPSDIPAAVRDWLEDQPNVLLRCKAA